MCYKNRTILFAFNTRLNLTLPIPWTAVSIKSMNTHRIPNLKRAVAVLFLLTSLSSQIQVVFACDLMDGQPKPVCCCGDDMSDGCAMGGGCSIDGAMARNPNCCEASVDSLSDVTMGTSTFTSSLVALQNAAQPPPVALCTIISRPQPEIGSGYLPLYHQADIHFERTEIYLVTKRLRI